MGKCWVVGKMQMEFQAGEYNSEGRKGSCVLEEEVVEHRRAVKTWVGLVC